MEAAGVALAVLPVVVEALKAYDAARKKLEIFQTVLGR